MKEVGPYIFGLFLLILIWIFVVSPTLEQGFRSKQIEDSRSIGDITLNQALDREIEKLPFIEKIIITWKLRKREFKEELLTEFVKEQLR